MHSALSSYKYMCYALQFSNLKAPEMLQEWIPNHTKGTKFIFLQKIRSEIQLYLVEFSDLKFLDLHHLIYWSFCLQKEPRKVTQFFIIQRFWSTGFCFESLYSLIHWPWYCVVWSPLYRGIIIECLIVEIEQVQLNITKLPSLISLLIGI